jgi:MoxR-like ATPase
MNLNQVKPVLNRALDLKIPLMIWGPPGVGKSTLMAETAKERGEALTDLRLAQLDAADLRGIPVPRHDTRQVLWYPPCFLPSEGRGILFLDEIDKAPPTVKNAALQLVLDRRLGDYALPEGWSMACAGNREEDNAFSSPIGSALANRMLHVEVEADLDTWIAWARPNGVPGEVVSFLKFRPELLYKQTGEHAFPSPRSWAAASRLMEGAGAQAAGRLLAAAVGGSTAGEFAGWSKMFRSVRVEEILAGRLPAFPEKDASFRYAVVLAVAAHITAKGLPEGQGSGLAALLGAVTPELRVLFFRNIPSEEATRLAACPQVRDITSKMVAAYVG